MTDDSAEQFCKMVYNKGHESVVEHAVASLRIVCDRGVSHEIVRHRIASYSQESTRYCNYTKEKFGNEISVIEPIDLDDEQFLMWYEGMAYAERCYFGMLAKGCTPQVARDALPTCLKTELVMTTNFREWKHFLKLRLDPAAHPKMRVIAKMVKEVLAKECPYFFGDPI